MAAVVPITAPAYEMNEAALPTPDTLAFNMEHTLPPGADGVNLKYMDTAPGSTKHDGNNTVILNHGMMSNTINSYGDINGVIMSLHQLGFRVIGMDFRGHGSSDKPTDPALYGENLVTDVKRLVDHLKLDKFHIAGYSAGSETAIAFTVKYPEHVLSLTTGGSAWSHEGLYREILSVGNICANPFVKCCYMCCDIGYLLKPSPMPYAHGQNIKMNPQDKFHLASMAAFSKAGGGTANAWTLTEEQMRNINVPMFSIFGTKDPEIVNGRRMEGVVPNLARVEVPGLDHEKTFGTDPEGAKQLRQHWCWHLIHCRELNRAGPLTEEMER
mmetsp:Transcript_30390/g.60375  ORF Transcript_30390/g.60375 Transcript_30390/m.60375 type:complete len:327 (+) Transcript_30390:76-1056(+)|eukprot:CAMPEP_0182456520 /NCGR_PEP_ID=MMETSP1319-20130603/2338_1 /TAXON_ID=172717 /ORGANISM="Bolidomonas pacifica, Strain RCC208" /LENGTH=326 /DNA_ID=CAMNT_0024654789 /DNA_START=99 /DNA_END=1079 /DNA_ORIENTATION=+